MDRIAPTMTPEKRERIVAFKQFFESESGKKVLEDLKDYSMYNTSPVIMRENGIDPLEVLFLNGREDVIKYILRQINKDLPV